MEYFEIFKKLYTNNSNISLSEVILYIKEVCDILKPNNKIDHQTLVQIYNLGMLPQIIAACNACIRNDPEKFNVCIETLTDKNGKILNLTINKI